jgi:hypothetical protein
LQHPHFRSSISKHTKETKSKKDKKKGKKGNKSGSLFDLLLIPPTISAGQTMSWPVSN